MAKYTNLNQQQLETILIPYQIGKIDRSGPLEGGAENSSFYLETSKKKYILTVCEGKSMNEISNLVKTLDHLDKHNFPTTKIVKTKNKKPFVIQNNKPVLLKEYIQGKVIENLTIDMTYQLGEKIAQLHGIPSPEGIPTAFPYGKSFFQEVTEREKKHPYVNWLNNYTKKLEQKISIELPKGLVHGDIFYDNVLFDKNELTAILDFEEVSNYYFVFDLGMAIIGSCKNNQEICLNKAKSLISGYTKTRQLNENEKKSIKTFTEYGAVATSFWRFRQYHLRRPEPEKKEKHEEMVNLAESIKRIKDKDFSNYLFS